jgi:hypothetical protein
VIEVKILRAATENAAAFVSLPHGELHISRNYASMLDFGSLVWIADTLMVRDSKLKLEHLTSSLLLCPRVDQLKEARISPDSDLNLLVDPELRGRRTATLVSQGRFPK